MFLLASLCGPRSRCYGSPITLPAARLVLAWVGAFATLTRWSFFAAHFPARKAIISFCKFFVKNKLQNESFLLLLSRGNFTKKNPAGAGGGEESEKDIG